MHKKTVKTNAVRERYDKWNSIFLLLAPGLFVNSDLV